MKAAVVLTGHLRCWEQNFPHFEKFYLDCFGKQNVDVYIHCWNDEGWWTGKENDKGIAEKSPKIDFDKVNEYFNPVSLIHQKYEVMEPFFEQTAMMYEGHRVKNTISMYYKLCAGLKEVFKSRINYDVIIRTRNDLIFHQDIDFKQLKSDVFYTVHHTNPESKGTGDMFQAGNMDSMFKFSHILNNIDTLYKKLGKICPHELSKEWINMMGIKYWSEIKIAKSLQHTPNGQYTESV